jgi:hypothetical protein
VLMSSRDYRQWMLDLWVVLAMSHFHSLADHRQSINQSINQSIIQHLHTRTCGCSRTART